MPCSVEPYRSAGGVLASSTIEPVCSTRMQIGDMYMLTVRQTVRCQVNGKVVRTVVAERGGSAAQRKPCTLHHGSKHCITWPCATRHGVLAHGRSNQGAPLLKGLLV